MARQVMYSGIIAHFIDIATAIRLNSAGYAVILENGNVIATKEKATDDTAR